MEELIDLTKTPEEINLLSPLTWAYIGDCIYELYVRTELVNTTKLKPHAMHVKAIEKVRAKSQAEMLNKIYDKLTEEEIADFRNKIEDYNSAVELKKDIAVCLLDKQSNEEKIEESNYALINSRKNTFTGIEAIVAKYANKK